MVRQRIRLEPLRKRIRLQSLIIPVTYDTRPKEYMDLRYWWLHELAQLRARRRIAGASTTKDIKVAQRELARLRKEYC